LHYTKTNIHFHYPAQFFLELNKIHRKAVEKLEIYILYSVIFFSENLEKYCRAGQATDDNMAPCALHAGYLRLQVHSGCVKLIIFPLQQRPNVPQCYFIQRLRVVYIIRIFYASPVVYVTLPEDNTHHTGNFSMYIQ
jgi:hypothetical protein